MIACRKIGGGGHVWIDVHLVQLALSTTGNLLGPQLDELLLQLIALLLQLLLVLAPELVGLDFAGRLR